MDKILIQSMFGELVSKVRSPTQPTYPDSIDLGYHTLDNTNYRLLPIRNYQICCHSRLELIDLDDDVLIKILSYLTTHDLCSVAQTCQRLWEIAWLPCLWREVQIRHPQSSTSAFSAIARRGYTNQLRRLFLENINELPTNWTFCNLSSLTIRHAKKATDYDVGLVLDNCPQMKELDLTGKK